MIGNVQYGIKKNSITLSGKNEDVRMALGILAAECGNMKLVDYLKLMTETEQGKSVAGLNLTDLKFDPDLEARLKTKNKKTLPRISLVDKIGFCLDAVCGITLIGIMPSVMAMPAVQASFALGVTIIGAFVIGITKAMFSAANRLNLM